MRALRVIVVLAIMGLSTGCSSSFGMASTYPDVVVDKATGSDSSETVDKDLLRANELGLTIATTDTELVDYIAYYESVNFLKVYVPNVKEYTINNMYRITTNNYLLDFTSLNERYLCKVEFNDYINKNADFSIDNTHIVLKDDAEFGERLPDFTNFIVNEYNLKEIDLTEAVKISNRRREGIDLGGMVGRPELYVKGSKQYTEPNETESESVLETK